MKNYLNKIIVGIFSVAILFASQNAFASSMWNGASNDCKSISIVNATTNEGYQNPCWPSSSVSAEAGDTINVRVYYHNTGTQTANNTHVVVNAPTGSSSTTKSITGRIVSDQGSVSFGPVTANISSSQSLSFSSVKWYTNNTRETLTPLLSGQNGSEVLNDNGLAIGSIASGWATQGSVVVSFKVSSNSSPSICQDRSANNYGRTMPCTYTVNNYCSISGFSASPSSISYGDTSTLNWNTNDCTNVTISNLGYNVPTSGSQLIYPSQTTSYILTAHGGDGSTKTKSVTVYVENQPSPSSCNISNFTVNGYSSTSTVSSGDKVRIVWDTDECSSVTVSGPEISSYSKSGSQYIYPQNSGTYTISAYGNNSGTRTKSIYLSVDDNNNDYNYNYCTISEFTIDGSSSSVNVSEDEKVRIVWDTDECSSVTVSGPEISSYSKSGSQYIYPQNSGTYTISAYGNNSGTRTKSIYVSVDNNNNYNNTPSVSTYAPTNVTTTSATLSGYVNGNGSSTNSWIEFPCYGSKYGNRYSSSSSSITSSVYSLSPNTTYTYCAAAQNNNGQVYRGNQVSFTTLGNNTPVYVNNNNVVTTVATNVTRDSATINGYITNSNFYNSNVYFEYGTSAGLGLRTSTRSSNGNSAFNEPLVNLSPNTIYFFRAISESSSGVQRGTVEIFRTLGAAVTQPIIIQGTTVVGSSSPVMLKIENRYTAIGGGDTVDYTVTYKNIGKTTLAKPVLQVIVPKGIVLSNTTAGTYSSDTNTLTVPLGDLTSGEEGSVNVEGKVESIPSDSAQIVTTAVLVYTNKSGAQENAMAYVLNNPKTSDFNSLLGASAFFGGIFPTTLIGWLLLLILIMIMILVARSFYKKQTVHATGEMH